MKGKRKKQTSTRTSTTSECAEQLSLSDSLLRDYVSRGCPHDKGGPGKSNLFDPREVAAWMKLQGLTGKPGRPSPEDGSDDLKERLLRAKTEKEEEMAKNWRLDNERLEGALIGKEEYRRHWIGEIQTIKNKCRGLGASIAPACVGLEAGEIQSLVEQRVEQIFRELSE